MSPKIPTPLTASVTLYNIKFDNRIEFLPANLVSGIDYLGQVDGVYENVGGVESHGMILCASDAADENLSALTTLAAMESGLKVR